MKKLLTVLLMLICSILVISCEKETNVEQTKLEVSFKEKNVNISLNETNEYLFQYTVNKESTIEITTDSEKGVIIENDKAIFSEKGTYKFVITASTATESATDETTVTVTSSLSLKILEKNATVYINENNRYILLYETNESCFIKVNCDVEDGYSISNNKAITFDRVGVYTFTVTAISDTDMISDSVVVKVVEKIIPTIEIDSLNLEFNSLTEWFYPSFKFEPSNAKITFSCDGNVEVSNKGIKFNECGTFKLIITATVGDFSTSKEVEVYVYDTIDLSGDGTVSNPWKVNNANDLVKISDTIFKFDADFEGMHFLQTADIDLSGIANWTPIGTIGLPFGGTYDGGNYKIENLNINTSDSFQGLFGFVTGVIKNVTVKGEIIVTTKSLPYSHSLVGGIAGGINNGAEIINCVNYVNIQADASAGGIVGEILETDIALCGVVFSKVTNCINYGNITALIKNSINENAMYYGGIAGKNHGIISGCSNYGMVDAVTYSALSEKISDYIGGITGYSYQPFYSDFGPNGQMSYSAIDNCKNFGDIKGNHAVGGIVGQHVLQVTNCLNEGIIIGVKSVGGIAGITGTSSTTSNNYTFVKGCSNNGEIISQDRYAGGITGYTYDDIIDCYNNGLVHGAEGVNAQYLGGIVGNLDTGFISGCENNAAITGSYGIGGIAGQQLFDVYNCVNTGTITGDNCVGGISGIAGSSSAANYGSATITNCENSGSILCKTRNAGGIAGYSYALIDECKNSAEIKSINETNGYYFGGIAGNKKYGNITNSSNSGNVIGNYETGCIGGIVGINTLGNIEKCSNSGSIAGYTMVGGIIGSLEGGKVSKSTNAGTILSTSNYAGGIAGVNGGKITECVNGSSTDETLGKVTASLYAGGITARSGSSDLTDNSNIKVEQCINYGQVSITKLSSAATGVGGIVGFAYSNITNSDNYGSVSGRERVGGIVGGISTLAITISNCNNYGEVTATVKTVGGIVGRFEGTTTVQITIEQCTNKGNVSCTAESGEVYVGGIVGYGRYGSVSNNINFGTLMVSSSVKKYDYIIGGQSNVTLTNNQDLH